MTRTSIVVALLTVGGSAWAAGGVGGAAGAVSAAPQAGTPVPAANPTNLTGNATSTNASTLPPPPPSSLNPTAASQNTIPPTPAPATAGLPATPNSPSLPSAQGLSATTANEARPSPSLSVGQVADVQAALAAGGLYRGPIDGNMSASLHASIKDFQQIVGLPQTGNLDAETAARLSNSSAVGGSASNGNTSTSGNLGAIQPFSPTPTVIVPAGSTPAGTATFSTPFQLSNPINTSNTNPPGVFIQP
jgi:putative peptidoglycan binding protein